MSVGRPQAQLFVDTADQGGCEQQQAANADSQEHAEDNAEEGTGEGSFPAIHRC
jgi:hypothetical protein